MNDLDRLIWNEILHSRDGLLHDMRVCIALHSLSHVRCDYGRMVFILPGNESDGVSMGAGGLFVSQQWASKKLGYPVQWMPELTERPAGVFGNRRAYWFYTMRIDLAVIQQAARENPIWFVPKPLSSKTNNQ